MQNKQNSKFYLVCWVDHLATEVWSYESEDAQVFRSLSDVLAAMDRHGGEIIEIGSDGEAVRQ